MTILVYVYSTSRRHEPIIIHKMKYSIYFVFFSFKILPKIKDILTRRINPSKDRKKMTINYHGPTGLKKKRN